MKNKLPLIIISVVAITAGVFASAMFSDSDTGAPADDTYALASLQESLKTSIALPLDFKTVPDFQLLDANAQSIDQTVFDDKWSIVFFGYTHCPDVCPITLQIMKNVTSKIAAKNGELPQIVFVSVDPVRDTSEVMKNYINFFNEEFVGITGELKDVHAMTSSLGIVASFTANKDDPDNYLVDHTASLLLIDPERRLRAKISPPHVAETIVDDYLLMTNPST
ncbi:MAG: SCO family protein [Granulosicoccus sp.]